MNTPKLTVLSLGWGRQSFTIAAMVALGELPPLDFAIHADTGHEAEWTYEFASRWTAWLVERGVNVVTVRASRLWQKFENVCGIGTPPFFTSGNGMLDRSCTQRWKIQPMRKFIAEELAKRGLKKTPGVVEQWLGFGLDEVERIKPNYVRFIENAWPLIDKRMTTNDCLNWLKAHGLEIPKKSACYFCPFRSNEMWRGLTPNDMSKAIEVDARIRKARSVAGLNLYVHAQRRPLREIDFQSQMPLMFAEECSGVCFV